MARIIKKKCEYCNKLLWNIPRHLKTCKAAKNASNFQNMPENCTATEMIRIRQENSYMRRQLIQYKTYIQKIKLSLNCKCTLEEENSMTLEEAAKVAIVKHSTQRDYLSTVKQYSEFCAANKLSEFRVDSGNQFLGYLNQTKRTETVKKRSRHLSALMKIARPEKPFPLQKVSSKDGKLHKHVLKHEEVEDMVKEALETDNKPIAVLIELMYSHALRINAALSATGKSLRGNILEVYESKVSTKYQLVLEKPLLKKIKELIDANGDLDSYVFFPSKTGKKRLSICTTDFNKYLAKSRVNPNDSTKFTTHIFRTSKANEIYNEGQKGNIEKVQIGLKHSSAKTSMHYLKKENTIPQLTRLY